MNLLENTPNQPTKFRTKNWVEINDHARGTYHTNSRIKFKTLILKSSLYDAYILVSSGTIIVPESTAGRGNNNIQVVFKNCALFTDCIIKINNT